MEQPSSPNSSNRPRSSKANSKSSPKLPVERGNLLWDLEPLEETLVNPDLPPLDRVALRVLRRCDEWKAFRSLLRRRASRALSAALTALAANKDETALALLAVVAEYRELIAWSDQKPPLPDTVEIGDER